MALAGGEDGRGLFKLTNRHQFTLGLMIKVIMASPHCPDIDMREAYNEALVGGHPEKPSIQSRSHYRPGQLRHRLGSSMLVLGGPAENNSEGTFLGPQQSVFAQLKCNLRW